MGPLQIVHLHFSVVKQNVSNGCWTSETEIENTYDPMVYLGLGGNNYNWLSPFPSTGENSITSATPTQILESFVLEPGVYLVGRDIPPGLYAGNADQSPNCYWARLNGDPDKLSSIISNADNDFGNYYVEVKASDYALEIKRCPMAFLLTLPPQVEIFPTELLPGTYILGVDVQSGIYEGMAGGDYSSSCLWSRLKDFSGDADGILGEVRMLGPFTVHIEPGDFAFRTECALTRIADSVPGYESTGAVYNTPEAFEDGP